MNLDTDLPPIIGESTIAAPAAPRAGILKMVWKTIVFFWKYLVGALFCLSIGGAIAIVGWSYRLAQRSALRYWWALSEHRRGGARFADHLASNDSGHEHLHWPNWLLQQNFRKALRRGEGLTTAAYLWQLLKAPFHSLALNLKIGAQGIFNTWVLTMPACILWLFAWYDGWKNSFNKGYEQAPVGPLTGILGIVLFIAAMLYVPMAQGRQAVTGDWRSFYHFAFVWGLIRRHWLACLLLAGFTSLLFVPVVVMKTAPIGFGANDPKFPNLTGSEVIKLLNGYFFWCAFFIFPAHVVLRVLAARIYARGVLRGIQMGEIQIAELAPKERLELQRLNLIQVNPPRSRHVVLRVATSTTSLAFFTAGLFATAFVWFTFVAQIYISEFLMYHEVLAWLNQPLVQLPWFRYIPAYVQNPAGEFFLTALVIGVLFGGYVVAKRVRTLFKPHQAAISTG